MINQNWKNEQALKIYFHDLLKKIENCLMQTFWKSYIKLHLKYLFWYTAASLPNCFMENIE